LGISRGNDLKNNKGGITSLFLFFVVFIYKNIIMRNLFNLNESEKNRILSLHDNHKLKMYGLIKEAPETNTAVNEYLNEPRLGDPYMYLKVGDDKPTYYIKVTDKPSGKYENMTKYPEVKANWDSVSAKYPTWTPATATQSAGISKGVKFQTTPVPGGIINKTQVTDPNAKPNADPNANQTPDKIQPLKPNQVTSDKGIDPNAQIQRNLDLQTRKDGQINVKDAAKQIKQQDKNAEKLFQQMENDVVKSCLVPVKNIEKSYFGRGIFNRAMKPEQIDQLLKQDKIKQELITNLTELFKKIKVPVGATLLDTGKRCVDYDKVKQQIGKFPNFKPEELAKKVGLDINNLSEKPKNVTPPKAAAEEYKKSVEVVNAQPSAGVTIGNTPIGSNMPTQGSTNNTTTQNKGGTTTGGSGMGAMERSDAEFDAMINQGSSTPKTTNVDLTNTAGPVNTNNQNDTSGGNEKLNYLQNQLNTANKPKTNTKPNEPDEEDYYSGTLGSKFK
jgi:hypothetical protein